MTRDSKKTAAQKREHPDPHEGNTPIPKTIITLIILVLLWAVSYIISTTPANDAPELGDHRTLADLMPRAGSASGAVDGAQIFAAQCVACHQANGGGLPGVFPPLTETEYIVGDEKLPINILLHGISGKLTVNGNIYNGLMPNFGDKLSDEEIAAVLSHVRTSFGNSASKIEAAAVKAIREAGKDRTTPWNGDEELRALK